METSGSESAAAAGYQDDGVDPRQFEDSAKGDNQYLSTSPQKKVSDTNLTASPLKTVSPNDLTATPLKTVTPNDLTASPQKIVFNTDLSSKVSYVLLW